MVKNILIGTAFALAFGAPAIAGEPVFASWPPAADYYNTDSLPQTIDRIAELTDGKVQWKLIAGGQLATPRDTLSQLGEGLFQGGLVIPPYNPKAMPSLTLLYTAVFPGSDPVAHVGAAVETVFLNCPKCLEEAKASDIVPLGAFVTSSYRLMCSTKVSSLSEMQGLRIRATGGFGEMVAHAGATPMSSTLTETVGLLQKGGLDCIVAARDWLKIFGYGEFVKHVTDLPLGTTGPGYGFGINRDTFLSFSADEQEAHLRANTLFTALHTINNFILRDEETFQQQVKDNGVGYVAPSADLRQLVDGFATFYHPNLLKRGTDLGVEDPEMLISTYFALYEKWQGISEEIGTDVNTFADVLWREVYSKVDPSTL